MSLKFLCRFICFSSCWLLCSSSMHPTTNNPLPILLSIIVTTVFTIITGGALQLQQARIDTARGSCIPAERAALLSFKKAITSDPANLLTRWHDGDCCRWRGITCSNQTSHVLKVHLRNIYPDIYTPDGCWDQYALLGEISPSLLSLAHLNYLDLSMNCLVGPSSNIPVFLGSMKKLRYLNLSGIPFTGRVPPQLGNLSNLQYLDIGAESPGYVEFNSTYSTDISWLRNLPSLQYLSLRGINLTGIDDWPQVLNMIPSLRVISLPRCSLDRANQSFGYLNLTKLLKLDLSLNFFYHEIASCWFWKVTSLMYLSVPYNFLFGSVPDAIGNITSLLILDLSDNNVDIMMTRNLNNLCSLEITDLSSNMMNTDITELMEKMPRCAWGNLRELYFGKNGLTGTLPNLIGNFSSLRTLILDTNNLSGSIPQRFGNCKRLKTLRLSNNHLCGSLPHEIADLTSLALLDLSFNDLSGTITGKNIAGLISLKNLDMSFNNFEIALDEYFIPSFRLESAHFASCNMGPLFPAWLKQQRGITELDISSTGLEGHIPNWFWSTFSSATYVDISSNVLVGNLPSNFEDMDFVVLNLSSNQLTGPIPPLPINIVVLDISNNSFSGTLPGNILAPDIETLLMFSNQIIGSIPESIFKLQHLVDLDLSSNLFEGQFPQCFEANSIRYLLLSNNNLSGTFPALLRNCLELEFLDLSWNKLSGRLPSWIGEFTYLRFLQLSHNTFSGNIPVRISNLSHLQLLDLSCNYLSGVIPPHLSNLTGMTSKPLQPLENYALQLEGYLGYTELISQFAEILLIHTKGQQLPFGGALEYFVSIDLSNNSLTGEIPTDITYLDALINLNLSSNHLSGKIPSKIGALKLLESLDLSENELSCEIPSSLSSLTYLSYLNLSYNNLSGRIPSGHQLDTLNTDNPSLMYMGNSALCGPPLQKNCTRNRTFIHSYQRSKRRELEPMSFFLGLGMGLVVGLSIVLCALFLKQTWRINYFMNLDMLYDRICVSDVKFAYLNWNAAAG